MKHTLERQENLWVKQSEVVDILTDGGAVSGVVTYTGAVYRVKAAWWHRDLSRGTAPSWGRWSGTPVLTAWLPPSP